jgi:hypothetical protein
MNRHCILAYQNHKHHYFNVAGIAVPTILAPTMSNTDVAASWLVKNYADTTISL